MVGCLFVLIIMFFSVLLKSNFSSDKKNPETNGTAFMTKVPVKDGDTVGIMVQQSDLPMIQFTVNGEEKHDLSITRFKGQVYPAVYLPEGEEITGTLVFDEDEYKQAPPNSRFMPVIVARGLI